MSSDNEANGVRVNERLAEAVWHLAREIRELGDKLKTNASLDRLAILVQKLMATQTELAADIRAVTQQLVKSAEETKVLQGSVDVLKEKIAALEAAQGNDVTQEVTDAMVALKAQAQIVDENIPDPVSPPARRN